MLPKQSSTKAFSFIFLVSPFFSKAILEMRPKQSYQGKTAKYQSKQVLPHPGVLLFWLGD